jgi:TatD DNase family protein
MHFWNIHTHRSGQPNSILNEMEIGNEVSVFCSVGIHPWHVDVHWEENLQQIQTFSRSSEIVLAIGEAGFDRLKGPEISLQKGAFYAQARWAAVLGIPLILHCVKAHDLLLEYFKSEKNPPAIIWHGWNLKPELAQQLLAFPVSFSFGKHLLGEDSLAANWLRQCPIDRIFFETDDSDLQINSIYRAASLILKLPLETLATQVVSNWNAISKRKIS